MARYRKYGKSTKLVYMLFAEVLLEFALLVGVTFYALRQQAENAPDTPEAAVQKTPVHIFLERKGRGGKTATIICDLTLDDEDLRQLAAELKRSLGCGGSARGGEILIQGDRVAECRRMLAARGYKVK